jgi:hypothetical protein
MHRGTDFEASFGQVATNQAQLDLDRKALRHIQNLEHLALLLGELVQRLVDVFQHFPRGLDFIVLKAAVPPFSAAAPIPLEVFLGPVPNTG